MEHTSLQRMVASHYYKMRQELLKNGEGNILQKGAIIIAKWEK